MNAKYVGVAVVGLLVVASVGAAAFFGVGPAPGGGDADSGTTPTVQFTDTVVVGDSNGGNADSEGAESGDGETATADDGEGADGSGTSAPTESLPPFTFAIDEIEKCGSTCRDVTVTLSNNQDDAAEDVVVVTKMFTGGDKIWQGRENVGQIDADESVTRTETVELSYAEGYKVKQNDGEVVIKTFVSTDDNTFVFERQRDVTE